MMQRKSSVPLVFLVSGFFMLSCPTSFAEDDADTSSGFRSVLEMAELGPELLAEFSDSSEYNAEDWKLFIQLLYRLDQYPSAEQANWAIEWNETSKPQAGDLVDVAGTVESVEVLAVPEQIAQAHDLKSLYRCHFRFALSAEDEPATVGTVLAAKIPKAWQAIEALAEPIHFRGILLRNPDDETQSRAIFLTPHLAWYPRQGVPTGELLLARHGMDVALFDEVMHRKPFVGPEVSREGEAFYSCLAAISRVLPAELSTLSKQSITQFADHWRESQATDRQQRAIAARVLRRSELGLSSVAPLFLQPEQMMGRLVRIEGIARRAVRIAVADRLELDSYFEVEIFPPDSQNQPVVGCVKNLPAEFPTGDAIREPVRLAGVFFKSWLYHSRDVEQTQEETGRQQRMYTPVVVGTIEWLPRSASQTGLWGLWGGIAFLIVLVIVSLNMVRLAKKDRLARTTRRHLEDVELPKN